MSLFLESFGNKSVFHGGNKQQTAMLSWKTQREQAARRCCMHLQPRLLYCLILRYNTSQTLKRTSRLCSRWGRVGSQPLSQAGPPEPNLVIHCLLYSTEDENKQSKTHLTKATNTARFCPRQNRGRHVCVYLTNTGTSKPKKHTSRRAQSRTKSRTPVASARTRSTSPQDIK